MQSLDLARSSKESILRKLFICQFLIAAFPALGSVMLSKEYSFPPTLLATVESKVQEAVSRAPDMQEHPIFYSIDNANGISLWCPPHMPKADGTGCFMNFLIESESLAIVIKKGWVLSFNSQQIIDHLKATDPNAAQEHQHFGSPFSKADTFGSHYYCKPEGTDLNKSWQCYLFVNESFGDQ